MYGMFDGIAAARIKSRLHTFADVVVVLTSQTDYMGVIFLSLLAMFLSVCLCVCQCFACRGFSSV